jgi:hypothetical protein
MPPSGRRTVGALWNLHLQDPLTECSKPAPGDVQRRTWRSRSGRDRGMCRLNHYHRAAGTPRRDERIVVTKVAKLAPNCSRLEGRMEIADTDEYIPHEIEPKTLCTTTYVRDHGNHARTMLRLSSINRPADTRDAVGRRACGRADPRSRQRPESRCQGIGLITSHMYRCWSSSGRLWRLQEILYDIPQPLA